MPAFAFTARSSAGKTVKGTRVVALEGGLAPALAAEGLFLIRAQAAGPPRALGRGRPTPREGSLLMLHLASYLEAGIPLLTALQDFREPGRPRLEAAVMDLAARLGEGASLSASMAAHPGLFQPLHVGMIRAGETAGRLEEALRAVLKLMEWNQGLRAQVRRAAVYPLILAGVLTVIMLLVCVYSLPPILKLLEELHLALPVVTRVFLALGHGLVSYGWLAAVLLLGLLAGLTLALRRPAFRLAWDGALLNLPWVGPFLVRVALARFARFFAAQYRAGLPLVQALGASEEVTGNARISASIQGLRREVEQGGSLAASAAKAGYFPQLVLRMLALGETTGKLEETLERAAAQFDAEVEEGARLFFQVLEPALKVVMAGVLIFVATAVLLPLYTLIGGIHG